jgi:hypothetical protein
MKLLIKIITSVAILLTASCTHINVTKTGSGIFPPTQQSTVQIRGTEPKDRKFDEVGMIHGDIFGQPATGYNLIRQKAAAIGADAVILNNQITIGARTIINGVAIKYSSE